MDIFIPFIIVVLVIVVVSIRQINEYERGVKFQLGKYKLIMQPGWRMVWLIIQTYQKARYSNEHPRRFVAR